MKRFGIVAIIIIGILVLAGAYMYERNSNIATTENEEPDKAAKQNLTVDSTKSSPLTLPGVYKQYDESLVSSANGPVLLFFHAPWCPQCRMIDADITQNGLPDGVTVLKIDYDSSHELRKRYEVTLQTTFVRVNPAGDTIKKYVAYNEPTFQSVKSNLLD